MKNQVIAIGLFAVLASPWAVAQSQIVGLMPSNQTSLDLYNEVGGSGSDTRATLADLPMDVLETKAGHHRVHYKGKDYWVRGPQVRISRGSSAGCTTARIAPTTQTSSTPGVGKIGC